MIERGNISAGAGAGVEYFWPGPGLVLILNKYNYRVDVARFCCPGFQIRLSNDLLKKH